jgi:prepilin-type N-terminal cleavage/methylation domain-containing protein
VYVRRKRRGVRGFTLIELMISVAIIGLLASIAVPNFARWQAKSRRSEGFANLASLARAMKAYQAEHDEYPDVITTGEPTLPDPALYGGLGTHKLTWDGTSSAFFGLVGWEPDGKVFYSYEVNSSDYGGAACSCTFCFTATAHGDVDGDGLVSALMFVHPQRDSAGGVIGTCASHVGSYGTPTRSGTGDLIYDEVAIYQAVDEF